MMPSTRRKCAGATSSFKYFERSNWCHFNPPEGRQEKGTPASLDFFNIAMAMPLKICLASIPFSCRCFFGFIFG